MKKMTAQQEMAALRQEFGQDFAGSAFRYVDGEAYIVGKYGRLCLIARDHYDAWFFRPVGDGGTGWVQPLGARKLNNIRRACPEDRFTVLEGEMYTRAKGREFAMRMAPHLGIKKRRVLSAETRAKYAANVAIARAVRNAA